MLFDANAYSSIASGFSQRRQMIPSRTMFIHPLPLALARGFKRNLSKPIIYFFPKDF